MRGKYKAKRVDNLDKWIIGSLVNRKGFCPFIVPDEGGFLDVYEWSICQFVKTINGVDLYENDKIKADEDLDEYILVVWNEENARFQLDVYGHGISYGEGSQEIISSSTDLIDENVYNIEDLDEIEIIGNIHDK